jgi:hypothetical protein
MFRTKHNLRSLLTKKQAGKRSATDGSVSIAFPVIVVEATMPKQADL